MRRSSPTWSKGREVRARAAGSVRNVAEHRGGRRVSGGGPGDGLPLVPGGEPASGEDRAPLARKTFGVGGVRAQERALGDSRWAAEGVSRGAGQPVGRRPGSRVDAQGGRRFLPDSGGTRRDDGQVPARRAAAALPGGGTREARASGARRRRSGGRGTLALSNGGRRAGQPGRGGAAAGRGGERQGSLRVDQHGLGLAHGGPGGAAAAAGLERTSRGLGAGRQDNGAGGGPRRVAGGGPEAVAGDALGDDVAREGGAGIEPRNPTPEALRTEAATVAAIREALATSPAGLRRVKQQIKASYYKTDRSNRGACLGGYRTGAVRVCENRHLRKLSFREWDLAEARLPRRTLLGSSVNKGNPAHRH